jgi:hypothetical protein
MWKLETRLRSFNVWEYKNRILFAMCCALAETIIVNISCQLSFRQSTDTRADPIVQYGGFYTLCLAVGGLWTEYIVRFDY